MEEKAAILQNRGFRFGREIGKGAFADVFLSIYRHHATGGCEKLACKHIDKKGKKKIFVKKFLVREIEITKRLSQHQHPNIIGIHSMYAFTQHTFIFMRWARNGCLRDHLNKNGAFSELQAKLQIRQIADGVKFLHDLRIVHRDIKCENILLSTRMTPKLTDFGFAKDYSEEIATISTEYCGSPHYAAPEVMNVTPYNPFKSDVWSVAAVLFTMLHLESPFNYDDLDYLTKEGLLERPKARCEEWVSHDCSTFMDKVFVWNPLLRPGIKDFLSMQWLHCIKNQILPAIP